eukprot:g36488.t1
MMFGAAFAYCLLLSLPWAQSAFPAASPTPSLDPGPLYDFLSGSLEMELRDDTLETGSNKRMGRRETFLGLRHPHCSRSSESWSSTTSGSALGTDTVKYQVTITTASTEPPWKVFPLWHLLMFMKRFYTCCKLGYPCKKIKGYQGRLLGRNPKLDGIAFKVRGERYKRDLTGNFFIWRVVRVWNELPDNVVEA